MTWSTRVKKRDRCCVVCGKTEGLQAHHLFCRQKFSLLKGRIANGVALCEKHHKQFHDECGNTDGWIFLQWLAQFRHIPMHIFKEVLRRIQHLDIEWRKLGEKTM